MKHVASIIFFISGILFAVASVIAWESSLSAPTPSVAAIMFMIMMAACMFMASWLKRS